MKKAVSFILALLMIVVTIPMATVGAYAEAENPSEVVKIGTKEQFLSTQWAEGAYYVLTDNIDLGGAECSAPKITLNNATFDGNGYSITGFSIKGEKGFVALTGTTATIKNVTFGKKGGEISFNTVGAWVAYAVIVSQITPDQSCTMTGVTLHANINITTDVAGCGGGLVGLCQGDIEMENCKVYGTLNSKNGSKKPTITGFAAFVGCVGNEGVGDATGIFTNCDNYANVTAGSRVGGFVGWDRLCSIKLNNCNNFGKVEANGSTENNAGGLIGYVQNGIDLSIENCANHGYVKATNNAGGMIGQAAFNDDATISNCANYGKVEGQSNVGVAVGYMQGKADKTVVFNDVLNIGSLATTKWGRAAVTVGSGQAGNTVINRAVNLGDISGKAAGGSIFGIWKNSAISVYDSISAGTFTAGDGNNLYAIGCADSSASLTVSAEKPNFYAALTPSTDCANDAIALENLDAVLEKLNVAVYTSVWGAFKASDVDENGKATGIVLATPILRGLQMGESYLDGDVTVTSARFVGTIANSLRYKEIGYTITCNGKTMSKSTQYVYNTLSATDNGGQQIEYTAAELGGTYAFALTLTDIPTTGTISLVVNAYAIDTNGTRYEDAKYNVTFTNGACVGMMPVGADA